MKNIIMYTLRYPDYPPLFVTVDSSSGIAKLVLNVIDSPKMLILKATRMVYSETSKFTQFDVNYLNFDLNVFLSYLEIIGSHTRV